VILAAKPHRSTARSRLKLPLPSATGRRNPWCMVVVPRPRRFSSVAWLLAVDRPPAAACDRKRDRLDRRADRQTSSRKRPQLESSFGPRVELHVSVEIEFSVRLQC
jgi:hypothetical protein